MSRPSVNLFLEALSEKRRQQLLAQCSSVTLPQKRVLHDPENRDKYGYFLTSGVFSSVALTADGASAEVGITGNEGVLGALLLLGPGHLATQGVIQVDATGYRMAMPALQEAFDSNDEIRKLLLEFVQCESLAATVIAGCHRVHGAEQRLARWLLTVRDRVQDNDLKMTQTFLGTLLGTQRPTVTLIAQSFQKRGLLQLKRGRIVICDAKKLENVACECYWTVKRFRSELYSRSGTS